MTELFGTSLPLVREDKMATKTSDALKKLEEQLTCSICLSYLTNPKTLSCLHSFCHQCLEDLLDYNNDVKCPTCRSVFDLGEEGVDSLQTTFLVNNLMEVHDMLERVSGEKQVICDVCGDSDATGFCQECETFSCETCLEFHSKWKKNARHRVLTLDELADSAFKLPRAKPEVTMNCTGHNKPLDIYCETCEELICQHCTVRIHKDHEYDVVSDVFEKHQEAIELSLVPIDYRIDKAKQKLECLKETKERLTKRGESVKEDIQVRISQIIDTLFAVGSKLAHEVDSAVRRQEEVVDDKVESVDVMLSQLTACKEHVQQSLTVGSPQQVLSSKSKLIEHTQSVLEASKSVEFQSTDNFSIGLVGGVPINQLSIRKSVGKISCEGTLKDEELCMSLPICSNVKSWEKSVSTTDLEFSERQPRSLPTEEFPEAKEQPSSPKPMESNFKTLDTPLSETCTSYDRPTRGDYALDLSPDIPSASSTSAIDWGEQDQSNTIDQTCEQY